MSQEEALRRANERFYRAFREADITAMDAVWSREAEVACIHPGWPALRGRERVMASWRAILLDQPPPRIECARVEIFTHGSVAFVTCLERIPEVDSELVATNIFVHEAGDWLIVHHQAGPIRTPPRPALDDDSDEPQALN